MCTHSRIRSPPSRITTHLSTRIRNELEEEKEETDSVISDTLTERASLLNNEKNRKNKFTFALTNARSLGPKIKSLIDYFEELEIAIALITETWLVGGRELEQNVADLELGENLSIINKNRCDRRGGGVAIVYDRAKCKLGEYKIQGNGWEIIAAIGTLTGGRLREKIPLSQRLIWMSSYGS